MMEVHFILSMPYEQWLIKPNKVQTKQKSMCMRQMRSAKDVAGTIADKAKKGTNKVKEYVYEAWEEAKDAVGTTADKAKEDEIDQQFIGDYWFCVWNPLSFLMGFVLFVYLETKQVKRGIRYTIGGGNFEGNILLKGTPLRGHILYAVFI